MKNIITNEQMISITDLKKQAKIARKQNNNLSNHSESLKAIAKEYNYDSWEKLLDSAYLMVNQEKPMFGTGQKEQIHWHNHDLLQYLAKLKNTMNSFHAEYEFLNNNAGYNVLFNFFQLNVLNQHIITSPIYQKIKLLLDFMISSFIEYNQDHKEFKNILSFATLSKENPYFKNKLSANLSNKLRKYMKLNGLNIYGFPESQELQISDALQTENFSSHNEIILIINSLHEKINIMATVYDVVEKNKKDSSFLTNWLADYENFVKLSTYDEWVAKDIQKYQRLIQEYTSSFFNIEKHKQALEYLDYYINGRYGRESLLTGTKDEAMLEIQKRNKNKDNFEYDIENAQALIAGSKIYEFIFYYIIH